MKYKKTKRKRKKTLKSEAWDWLSRKVRLEGVLKAQQTCGVPFGTPIAQCYTCGALVDVTKQGGGQAGHFKSREIGGSSGLYFDERAIRVQGAQCNKYRQGRPQEFREGLVAEYGEDVVQELERLHKLPARWRPRDYPGMIISYQADVKVLLELTGIQKWWK